MSLQLVLASLFPPTGKHIWQEHLNWQPVPFNYWPDAEDHVSNFKSFGWRVTLTDSITPFGPADEYTCLTVSQKQLKSMTNVLVTDQHIARLQPFWTY